MLGLNREVRSLQWSRHMGLRYLLLAEDKLQRPVRHPPVQQLCSMGRDLLQRENPAVNEDGCELGQA